jgi:Holliday junction DNA helicase RuvA
MSPKPIIAIDIDDVLAENARGFVEWSNKRFGTSLTTDDGQFLYGFSQIEDLKFFELLITVSGVGPKIALGILSVANIAVLEQAIAQGDATFFGKMGGVGKKTAERIIVELKNKVGQANAIQGTSGNDVFDALLSLGYSQGEVRTTLQQINSQLNTDEQLKQALRLLAR